MQFYKEELIVTERESILYLQYTLWNTSVYNGKCIPIFGSDIPIFGSNIRQDVLIEEFQHQRYAVGKYKMLAHKFKLKVKIEVSRNFL